MKVIPTPYKFTLLEINMHSNRTFCFLHTLQNDVASGNIAAAMPFSSILESFCKRQIK